MPLFSIFAYNNTLLFINLAKVSLDTRSKLNALDIYLNVFSTFNLRSVSEMEFHLKLTTLLNWNLPVGFITFHLWYSVYSNPGSRSYVQDAVPNMWMRWANSKKWARNKIIISLASSTSNMFIFIYWMCKLFSFSEYLIWSLLIELQFLSNWKNLDFSWQSIAKWIDKKEDQNSFLYNWNTVKPVYSGHLWFRG